MKLNAEKAEGFATALETSKTLNVDNLQSAPQAIEQLSKEEIAKQIQVIHHACIQSAVQYCSPTNEEFEDEEEEVPVEVVEIVKKCKCGGEFEYTPGMTQTLEYPPHYTHTCNKCGKVERFLKTYPYQKYKRIKVGAVND